MSSHSRLMSASSSMKSASHRSFAAGGGAGAAGGAGRETGREEEARGRCALCSSSEMWERTSVRSEWRSSSGSMREKEERSCLSLVEPGRLQSSANVRNQIMIGRCTIPASLSHLYANAVQQSGAYLARPVE